MRHGSAVLMSAAAIAVLAGGAPVPTGAADAAASVTDIPLAGGVTQRVLVIQPAGAPQAALILFSGGDGVLKIERNGKIDQPGNFLVRTRQRWVEKGFAVVIPDTTSDHPEGLFGVRLTSAYADTVSKVVDFAHAQTKAAVWLVGTSQGTNAAANAGTVLTHGEIAGLVLTSTLTRPGPRPELKENVFDANLKAIVVPTLIVANTDDKCNLTPPSDVSKLKAALTQAKTVDVVTVSGGAPPRSQPCEALSPHGFYGIEAQVVDQISTWIMQHQ
ncbi:MAG TPA: alpha/beta hydrolase [bacterium]|nr:alpha/beta hydrolase [bacterium]